MRLFPITRSEVCKLADPAWENRIETSLNVPWRCVEPVLSDIDEWIIDIKDMDCHIYEKYTGVSIDDVLDNLYRIKDSVDKTKLHIRVPKIPGYNNDKMIGRSVNRIKELLDVEPEVFEYVWTRNTEVKNILK